jgi:CubicO group peptidase (beta-lactamase class C family)
MSALHGTWGCQSSVRHRDGRDYLSREQNARTSVFNGMRTSALLLCVLCIVLLFGLSGEVAKSKAQSTRATGKSQGGHSFVPTVDAVMPGLLQEFAVPGAAVALIRKGEVVWMQGYGFANAATKIPVTPETVFNVGSISKSPTAWAVMRLVESGKVDLDRPVEFYLKRWHLPPSKFDNSQVTVRRVLSHTSGISNHDYHGWDPETPLPPIEDSLSGKTGTGEVRVVDAPGSGFHYSGANYAILQLLIEDVSGQSFQDYVKANVFQPLHMSKSQYGLPPRFQDVMAIPYDGLGTALPIRRYNELSAAGLTTTLRDLATFAAAGLNGQAGEPAGRGVLRQQTIALMQSPAPATRWADRDPYGPDPQYGFGYTVRPEQFQGKVGIGHGGSNSGWESFFQLVPATGDGIVIMTNSSNGSAVISSLLCSWRKWAAGQSANVECPTIDIRAVLHGVYRSSGAKAAVARYRELRRDSPDKYNFAVWQLNSMGYELLRKGDTPGALDLFRLNVEEFPQDANVYDSLGEAYLKQGDKTRAIENYKKSLDLNPQNDNARNVLKKLEVPIG